MSFVIKEKLDYDLVRLIPSGLDKEKFNIFLKSVHSMLDEENKSGFIGSENVVSFKRLKVYKKNIRKIAFYTLITKYGTEYYLAVPNIFTEKMLKLLRNCKFENCEVIPLEDKEAFFKLLNESKYYELETKNHNCSSIKTDVKAQNEDFLGLRYTLEKHEDYLCMATEVYSMDNNAWKRITSIFKVKVATNTLQTLEKPSSKYSLMDFVNDVMKQIQLSTKSRNTIKRCYDEERINLSENSKEKLKSSVFLTSISLIGNSNDLKTKAQNAVTCYDESISEDNTLILKGGERSGYAVQSGKRNSYLSIKENISLLKYPDEKYMDEANIEHSMYLNEYLPEVFYDKTKGPFQGFQHIDGKVKMAYFYKDDRNFGFTRYYIGPKGAGKTTASQNIVICNKLSGRGTLLLDDENGHALSKGILRALDFMGVSYYHVDCTDGKEFERPSFKSGRTTLHGINFDFSSKYNDDDFNGDNDKYEKILENIRMDVSGKLALLKTAGNIKTSSNDDYLFKSVGVLLAVAKFDSSIESIVSFLGDRSQWAALKNKIISDYKCFCDLAVGVKFELGALANDVYYDTSLFEEARAYIYKMKDVLCQKSCSSLDFVEIIKKGIPVIVTMPTDCSNEARDTISLYFLKKVYDTVSKSEMINNPIAFEIIIDEVVRYTVALEFIRSVIISLRRRKLDITLTIHHAEAFKGTPFEGDFKKDFCHLSMYGDITREDFDIVSDKKGFTFDRDITNMKKLNGDSIYMFNSIKTYKYGTLNYILECPPVLCNLDYLKHFLEEWNQGEPIREKKLTVLNKLLNINKKKIK